MPIYEYHCDTCEKDFECLVFGNERPVCPSCNNKKVKKIMSACTFYSKSSHGQTVKAAASASSCGGCSATSCSSCSH
ncbi:MAG: zinc ribbon domain-containing protein [Deltaproteobacteria bacterium]|nr:zinc ribbon domain-containing protein [Deltaproteobacteria bacterium]